MESLVKPVTFIINVDDTDLSQKYNETQQYESDIGLDLFTPFQCTVNPGEKCCINLKVKCQAIDNHTKESVGYMLVPRSSIHKYGLMMCNSIGIIDPGYRGSLMAFVWNYTQEVVTIERYSRLFQVVLFSGQKMTVDTSSVVSTSDRSANGFGSTGT